MDKGWIKINRSLKAKGYYQKSEYVHLWIHLLLSVNHDEREFMWNGEMIKIKPGQLLTGRKKLSSETKIKSSTLERILDTFQKQGQIEQQKTNKWRLITILNWSKFQDIGQQVDNNWTTSGQQTDTNKNIRRYKNDKNIYPSKFEEFWESYPKKIGKGDAGKVWDRLKPSIELVETIQRSVADHKQSRQWLQNNGQYIPNPSTFLNQRRWEDEVKIEEKKSGIINLK